MIAHRADGPAARLAHGTVFVPSGASLAPPPVPSYLIPRISTGNNG